ncbi:MAG: 4-hydroxythreonine-4-phosphate dehydrogenase PdxA [Pseudomonadota bacterium]
MGDPSGIGPEIIVKAFVNGDAHGCVVAGCPSVIRGNATGLGFAVRVQEISAIEDAAPAVGVIDVLRTSRDETFPTGDVSSASGRAAFAAIAEGVKLARSGRASGLVTAPIHKGALAAAGFNYPGHTEILSDLAGAGRVAMMLANDEIRTVLVTIHSSLLDAIERADFQAQMTAIRLAHLACRDLGIAEPRVAVAGLNPHAGEGGRFGNEEIDIIAPAIKAARADGIDASGPWPGDTVFMAARKGAFDIVVAQYHDQGLIPVKYLGVEKGVNVTLGLPFVRTSPDHGTAFDIAGKGIADAGSLVTAIRYARRLAATRQHKEEAA